MLITNPPGCGWRWRFSFEETMGGVLTSPRSHWMIRLRDWLGLYRYRVGYAVPAMQAIAILEKASPEAARWWRENTPHLFQPDQLFLFQAEECERVKP